MDRTAIPALAAGLALSAAGIWAIWVFLPDVVALVKGIVGIIALCAGLFLLVLGFLLARD